MRYRLKPSEQDDPWYADVRRIRAAMSEGGYEITMEEARAAWERFSETMAAGWMRVPENPSEIRWTICHYFEEDTDAAYEADEYNDGDLEF